MKWIDNENRCRIYHYFQELTVFPTSIPTDTTELFLDSNAIDEISVDQISRLGKLVKL